MSATNEKILEVLMSIKELVEKLSANSSKTDFDLSTINSKIDVLGVLVEGCSNVEDKKPKPRAKKEPSTKAKKPTKKTTKKAVKEESDAESDGDKGKSDSESESESESGKKPAVIKRSTKKEKSSSEDDSDSSENEKKKKTRSPTALSLFKKSLESNPERFAKILTPSVLESIKKKKTGSRWNFESAQFNYLKENHEDEVKKLVAEHKSKK
jgi:hypothetical protein